VTSPPLLYSTARQSSTLWITTLRRKLSESFGVGETALQRLASFRRGRLQCFRYGGRQSEYNSVAYTVSHMERSSDRCSSSSTQMNSARWSRCSPFCISTNMLTTQRHIAGDHQQNQTLYDVSCRAALQISACGCKVIDYS